MLPKTDVENALNNITRRLLLHDFFSNKKAQTDYRKVPFTYPSTWTPPPSKISDSTCSLIDKLRTETRLLLNELPQKKEFYLDKRHNNNLSPELRYSLNCLRKNQDIIIKPADKGGNVCILDREHYISEAERQLDNKKYYITTSPNEVNNNKLIRELNTILFTIHERGLLTHKQLDYLKAKPEDKPRYFYLLPKIHKPTSKWPSPYMPEGRPIVGNCESITRRISDYVDSFLRPLATSHSSYLKDSYDFANKIRNQIIDPNWILVTGDITALYTNMNIDKIIESIKSEMIKNPDPKRPDTEIVKLLQITLRNNTFDFNNKQYLQIHGTAMGTPDAPNQANIYLLDFDQKLQHGFHISPKFYFRFLDDTFFLWPGTITQLKEFEKYLNSLIPDITITLNHNHQEIPFLDLTIYKKTIELTTGPVTSLQTKIFFKPTDNHQLLHCSSFHPKHTQRGVLKSHLLRFKRLSSSKTDFDHSCRILFAALKNRGYSKRLLRKYKNNIWNNTPTTEKRQLTVDKKKRILPMVIKYSPISTKLTKLWRSIITQSPKFKEFNLVAAYIRNRNLGEILAPSKLKHTQNRKANQNTLLNDHRYIINRNSGEILAPSKLKHTHNRKSTQNTSRNYHRYIRNRKFGEILAPSTCKLKHTQNRKVTQYTMLNYYSLQSHLPGSSPGGRGQGVGSAAGS